MKRVMAVCMAMVMMLAMTACAGEPSSKTPSTDTIVGVWEGTVDYAGVINSFLEQDEIFAASDAMATTAPVPLAYEFAEDGTVGCVVDREFLYTFLEAVGRVAAEPMIQALGGMSYDEYLAMTGMTKEEMMKSVLTEELVDSIESVFRFKGTYKLNENKLTVTVGGITMESLVEMGDGTMTLESPIAAGLDNIIYQKALQALYPLVLTKA